jgi:hypothetical protein
VSNEVRRARALYIRRAVIRHVVAVVFAMVASTLVLGVIAGTVWLTLTYPVVGVPVVAIAPFTLAILAVYYDGLDT